MSVFKKIVFKLRTFILFYFRFLTYYKKSTMQERFYRDQEHLIPEDNEKASKTNRIENLDFKEVTHNTHRDIKD